MLCITLTAAALVAAGAAFRQQAPEGNRVEINGTQMYYEVSGGGDPMIVPGSYMNIPGTGAYVRMTGRDAPRLRAGALGPRPSSPQIYQLVNDPSRRRRCGASQNLKLCFAMRASLTSMPRPGLSLTR
jgi:hypothetical protein